MQQLLANFELINRKLRTKIDKLEHENLPTLSK